MNDRAHRRRTENPGARVQEDFTVAHAKDFAQKTLAREVPECVAEDLGTSVEDARAIFAERKGYDRHRARYVDGTFIIEKLPVRGGAGAGRGPQGLDSSESWWARQGASVRAQWMLAFWAENSGDGIMIRIEQPPCSECGGRGYRTIFALGAAGGGQRYEICLRCHGLGHDRVVVFR